MDQTGACGRRDRREAEPTKGRGGCWRRSHRSGRGIYASGQASLNPRAFAPRAAGAQRRRAGRASCFLQRSKKRGIVPFMVKLRLFFSQRQPGVGVPWQWLIAAGPHHPDAAQERAYCSVFGLSRRGLQRCGGHQGNPWVGIEAVASGPTASTDAVRAFATAWAGFVNTFPAFNASDLPEPPACVTGAITLESGRISRLVRG